MAQIEEGQRALPLQRDVRLLSHDAHRRLSEGHAHVYHADAKRTAKLLAPQKLLSLVVDQSRSTQF